MKTEFGLLPHVVRLKVTVKVYYKDDCQQADFLYKKCCGNALYLVIHQNIYQNQRIKENKSDVHILN